MQPLSFSGGASGSFAFDDAPLLAVVKILSDAFLAPTLGVRRVGVTKAATALQQKKLITYRRGPIEIIDAAGLQPASCRCHDMVSEDSLAGMAGHYA